MKHIIRFRWLIAIGWTIVALGLFLFSPNLQELVREKGQITTPENAPSSEAARLIERMSDNTNGTSTSAVFVFHDDKGLTAKAKDEIKQAITLLEADKNVSNILDFSEDPMIESQTVSEDEKTIIVPFEVSLEDKDIDEVRTDLTERIRGIHVDHYLTGEAFISQDIIINSEEGLKKTELITVGLISIILFAVFKSLVAPFIPLLTVGISYLAAQGIVAILADTVNFPLSTFTQIFMVAVMFGIGTDYCILLVSRFKEEITKQESIKEAVLTTYKAGGKTIFFAGLAVLIGFSTIGLSTFSLYQSAIAVAVGVAVMLIAIGTLVPFFLVVLGKKLFWPFDKNVEHKESKIWHAAGKFAWARPLMALVIVLIIVVPALITYDRDTSYNSLEEIGDQYESVQGFNYISDSFGPGQTMPTTVVFETEEPIDDLTDFQEIEAISQQLTELDGVKSVRSATRPAGEVIEDFLIHNQTDLLADGIDQSTDGVQEIEEGLREASTELKNAAPELDQAIDGVDQLMQGTADANAGISGMKDALSEIQKGIQSGSTGAGEIKENLQTIKDHLDDSISANRQLLEGYQAIAKGLASANTDETMNPNDLQPMIDTLQGAKATLTAAMETAVATDESLGNPNGEFMRNYGASIAQIDGVIGGIHSMQEQMKQLGGAQAGLSDVITNFEKLNKGFSESISGQEQLSEGIGKLISGIKELQSGMQQAANGQGQVVEQIPNLENGLSQIYGGQEELKTAFSDMQVQLGTLSDGLGDGADGLGQIYNGLSQVQTYIEQINFDDSDPIVVIPDEALENDDFIEGTKPYISQDKKIVKFDVVLDINPYSTQAINLVDQIYDETNDAKQNTIFSTSDPKIGGVSSTNNDLQNISDEDYSRTVLLMLVGIFIMLVILLKSLIMPAYLIGSLILTYFTSMGFAEILFVNILGYDGLTWAVPFFAFVMLIALGVDYSIFLMDRFNEYRNGNIRDALFKAMINMGTVIISAAVILGGTFGAMLPSGVLSLLQIATVVLVGLFLYAFVMLPLFIPVMVKLFGKLNWWPFRK